MTAYFIKSRNFIQLPLGERERALVNLRATKPERKIFQDDDAMPLTAVVQNHTSLVFEIPKALLEPLLFVWFLMSVPNHSLIEYV